MLSFAAPWIMMVAGAGAVGVFVLHLLSVRRPPELALPTARFVVHGESRAVARRPRPTDLLLLLLRMLALLLAGAAFAGVQCASRNDLQRELVVVEATLLADSARWMPALRASTADSLERRWVVVAAPGAGEDPGAALVRAIRVAGLLAHTQPALQQLGLTVVLPEFVQSREGWDVWRTQWPGDVRLHTVSGANDGQAEATRDAQASRVASGSVDVLGGGPDDAVQWALRLEGAPRVAGGQTATGVVVRRDSVASRATARTSAPRDGTADGDVRVEWPVTGVPTGWSALERPDTVGALVARGMSVPGPWVRAARAPSANTSGTPTVRDVRAVVWWSDGEPAVLEQRTAAGCTRSVGIVASEQSDLLLSDMARGVREAVTAPCGVAAVATQRLWNGDSTGAVDAKQFRTGAAMVAPGTLPTWLQPVLLALALALLGTEWLLRRGEGVA
jgi:hypothetical protein